MKYDEAKKIVSAEKLPENMMVIELDYRSQIILPYADGLSLIKALSHSQILTNAYSSPKRIEPLDKDQFKFHLLSGKDYSRYKISMLLDVTYEEVIELENTEKQTTPA